jgi:hypothetical protein
MLYPVELRAPFEEQLICGGRAWRSNNAKKNRKISGRFPAQKRSADAGLWSRAREIVHPMIHPRVSLCEALRAGIDRSGVLRPCITNQSNPRLFTRGTAQPEKNYE